MASSHGCVGLIGREGELAALRAALAVCRLVTVTGAAGVGKSRLALEAVACPQDGPRQAVARVRWHDGVPVGPWAPAARIARALDAVTGTKSGHGAPDLAAAVRSLPGGGLLLVLDDVDPVLAECAGLVRSLLRDVPALRVLVTARRPLGLDGEHVLRLGPLASDASRGGLSPAAELFHALAARRGRAEEADRGAVDRVCALVEGVPLALELAVAQLGDLTVSRLADRLRGGQCWLSAAGAPLRRHRSVRASIGAVHALCDTAVRTVWRRLSVFAGTFTEQAAVFVCEGGDLSPAEVPPALAELSAVGVLHPDGGTGTVPEPRYRMARAARDFGAERLTATGESPAARARYARHCRSTAAVAEALWDAGLQQQAVRLVRDALDDLHAFLDHAVRHPGHAETAVETVLHVWFWWAAHSRGPEAVIRLLALLPLLPANSPSAARGQWLAGWLAADADPATARRLLDLAWPTAVLAGDDALIGRIAHAHGTLAWKRHDLTAAAAHYRQAADTVPAHAPGGPGPMVSLAALAVVQAHTSPALAARTARQALAQPAGGHDTWATALAHSARALADHRAGHPGRARRRAHRALAHLEARLDAPQAHTALRRLLHHIDHDRPGRSPRPVSLPSARPRLRSLPTTSPAAG
ncbi:AAA family ATPase [Streptomyces sp. CC208A]|uniref:ATP-binding protein n=1 Tax=Streptomyces sp. CC208A TaxID=3044573 RepID=UPI0024A8F385|nr:AAA family ATPase [Streptomyces sp. CC208A]